MNIIISKVEQMKEKCKNRPTSRLGYNLTARAQLYKGQLVLKLILAWFKLQDPLYYLIKSKSWPMSNYCFDHF